MNPAASLLKIGYTLIFYEIYPTFNRAAYISISYADLLALAHIEKGPLLLVQHLRVS